MAQRSGAAGVGIGTLGRMAVLPDRRLPHVVTALGDSRVAALYLDPPKLNRGTRSPLNWANVLLAQRMSIGETFGVSGDRTDQFLARLPAAIATGAGILYLQGGINNIGAVASGSPAYTYAHAVTGEVVTIDTVAAVAMRDLRQIIEAARKAGMTVVVENEIGGASLTTTEKLAALNNLRAMIADLAERMPGVFVHDAYGAVMQPGSGTPQFKAGYAYDGIHENGRGAYWHGKSLAALFDRLVPVRNTLSRGAIDAPANGRRQLLANHLFATAGGGTAGNGVTGGVPTSWTAAMGTNAGSATLSSVANPDGIGTGVQAAIDFTTAGSFRLEQALGGTPGGQYHANLRPGDEVEGFALVEVVGAPPTLSAIHMEVSAASAGSGGVGVTSLDMTEPATNADQGINDAAVLTLRTRPITLPAASGPYPYLFANIRVVAFGAGAATVIVRQAGVRRRSA